MAHGGKRNEDAQVIKGPSRMDLMLSMFLGEGVRLVYFTIRDNECPDGNETIKLGVYVADVFSLDNFKREDFRINGFVNEYKCTSQHSRSKPRFFGNRLRIEYNLRTRTGTMEIGRKSQ